MTVETQNDLLSLAFYEELKAALRQPIYQNEPRATQQQFFDFMEFVKQIWDYSDKEESLAFQLNNQWFMDHFIDGSTYRYWWEHPDATQLDNGDQPPPPRRYLMDQLILIICQPFKF